MGWWLLTEQVAGLVHGFLGMTQGLTQSWFRQASLEEQSSSSSQPTIGSGSTENETNCRLWYIGVCKIQLSHYIIGNGYKLSYLYLLYLSQAMSPRPTYPVSQVQIMVLSGKVFWTLQTALAAHGWIAVHGFWHSLLIQASRFGHSISPLHPVSIGTRNKIMNVYQTEITLVCNLKNMTNTNNFIIVLKLTKGAFITVWIPCVTISAGANATMISSTTISIFGAITRIDTLFVLAC